MNILPPSPPKRKRRPQRKNPRNEQPITISIQCPQCCDRAVETFLRKYPKTRIEREDCPNCGHPHFVDIYGVTKGSVIKILKRTNVDSYIFLDEAVTGEGEK